MRKSRIVLLGAGFWVVGVVAAQATMEIQKAFVAKYPKAKTTLGKCITCHSVAMPKKGAPQLNPFGVDVQGKVCADKKKAFDFTKVEGLDSDGDGRTNLQEIEAGTNPGDKSK